MGYESKQTTRLPSGLLLVEIVEDGYMNMFIVEDDEYSEDSRGVEHRSEKEARNTEVLGAFFKNGGWCDLFYVDMDEVNALGGWKDIERVQGYWSEPHDVMCG